MARDNRLGRFGAGRRRDSSSAEPAITDDQGTLDISAVRRDDELIDAIASDGPVSTDSDDEYALASLLAGWRSEIVTPELPDIDLDAIVAAVNQEVGARNARVRPGGSLRLVRPLVGAAAAIAVVVGVTTAFSYNAEPGDPLWKVKEVVFADQADSTVANIDTSADLQQAEQLITQGHPEEAQVLLDRAQTRANDVRDADQREDLLKTLERLAQDAAKNLQLPPGMQIPTTLPTLPTLPGQTTPAHSTTDATDTVTLPTTTVVDTTEPDTTVDTTDPTTPNTTEPETTTPTDVEQPTTTPEVPTTTTEPTVETTVPTETVPTETTTASVPAT